MAGDWIKMRNNLWDDPRVSQICDTTSALEATVIGGLYWLWSAADEHTETGHMPGLSVGGIDRKTGVKGFGAALVSVGWIEDTEGGITIIRFDEHNGSSAKRRSTDAQRKANSRNLSAFDADINATESGQSAPDCGAREEKRREENKEHKSKATPSGDLLAGIPEQLANDFKAMRNKLRAPITKTSIDGLRREAEKAELTLEAVLRICCERGWRGFKAHWDRGENQARASPGRAESRHSGFEKLDYNEGISEDGRIT